VEFASGPDLVFSPDHISELPELLSRVVARKQSDQEDAESVVQTGFADPAKYQFLQAAPLPYEHSPTALVTIQKGCDNSCAYCIVPSVRGPAVSRPAQEILEEVIRHVAAGTKEVTLIGQNVNAYDGAVDPKQSHKNTFAALLRAVDQITGLKRLRYTTSHPKDFNYDLAMCFRDLETLCPWLHLPVQSGSTRVLQLMNRGYTRDEYLRLIDQVRFVKPEIAIGTDLIVGFPGESEKDFTDTLSLVEQIQYDSVYSFKFSPRPNTAAETFQEMIKDEEKSDRLKKLQSLQNEITEKRLARFKGALIPVLIEGPSRKGLPQLCGRSPGNHVVNIDCSGDSAEEQRTRIGQIVEIRVTRAGKHSLFGKVSEASE
jgi:tRNA-2-methylthio-N6-dimethylallyladenosine synthase